MATVGRRFTSGGISLKVTGLAELLDALQTMDPKFNARIARNSLRRGALMLRTRARTQEIKRGGKGPPLPSKLTSRSGLLRRSIDFNLYANYAEVGTDLRYGPVHEFGLRATRRRRLKGGGTGVTTASYPKRPFLAPAGEYTARRWPEIVEAVWFKATKGGANTPTLAGVQ